MKKTERVHLKKILFKRGPLPDKRPGKKTFEIDISKTPLLNLKFSRWRSGLTIEQKR
jgi:hypothetical protein